MDDTSRASRERDWTIEEMEAKSAEEDEGRSWKMGKDVRFVELEVSKVENWTKEDEESTREDERSINRIDNSQRSAASSSFLSSHFPQVDPTERPSVKFAIVEDPREKRIVADARVSRSSSLRRGKKYAMPLSPKILGDRAGSEGTERDKPEDDYSASVCAIIQRRNSSRKSSRRKKHRRTSSFVAEDSVDNAGGSVRRRSSVFTTSSADTAISIEVDQAMMDEEQLQDSGTQEQIFENLKLHKEVISSVKHQPWSLRRKIKLVQQAKNYVRRHEGVLQERLAQSRNTRDALARVSIFINKKWQYLRRELMNLQTWMVPWERRIKEIESHFGSAVASYFIFLRWLFWINLVVSLILTAFVAIPEVLTANAHQAGERKLMLPEEQAKSKHLVTLWEFEGVLKYSPFFYGWYTNWDPPGGVYRLPLAYFLANLIVYTYSFVAILRKMAENSRMSKLSEKEDECAFSWKLFTGWDFMIGNPETAHNRIASIVLGFKESLLEEAEKEKKLGHWKIITKRVFVNLSVISLLALSAYAVVEVVARSTQPEAERGWWRQNEITVVMSLISYIFPIFFEILGIFENYHPRKQLRLQLARIMVLNLLNLYSLIFALFDKISNMEVELQSLKPKISKTFAAQYTSSNCEKVSVPCEDSSYRPVAALASLSLVLMSNMTSSNIALNANDLNESRINETTDDLMPGIGDFFYDFESSSAENSSVVGEITSTETSTSKFNDPLAAYENFDNEPRSNYDYYDTSNYQDPADENSTVSLNVSSEFERTTFDFDGSTLQFDRTTSEFERSTSESTSGEIYTNEFDQDPTTPSSTPETTLPENFVSERPEARIGIIRCYERVCNVCTAMTENYSSKDDGKNQRVSLSAMKGLDMKTRRKLRKLCWETMFGQELAKLTVMDLVLTVIATLSFDFFRALFTRYMNSCWCWDLEKQFPQYGDFKIAENILHLVNNQGMVWMGMFFSPGLAVLNLAKLGILMYLRSWAVLTCNVPHEVVFRASRSNNFYLALLLTMLFLCVLPVGYAIVWVEPSWHCGPFSGYRRIYYIATQSLKNALPGETFHKCLDYIASPGIVIPLIVLMALIIYYMVSLASSLREANNDLKIQLRQERTEERRKMFKIAEKRIQTQDTPFARWKKILPAVPIGKSTETPVSRVINTFFDLKNRREARLRSMNSEADEATDPNFSLPHDAGATSPRERIDSDASRNLRIDHNCIKDERGSAIPKIRIDSIEAETTA